MTLVYEESSKNNIPDSLSGLVYVGFGVQIEHHCMTLVCEESILVMSEQSSNESGTKQMVCCTGYCLMF